MATIKRLTGGRAWAARLSALLVLGAIVALVVAVLPAQAGGGPDSGNGVTPSEIEWGGGPGGCDFIETEGLVDSVGQYELWISNPKDQTYTWTHPDNPSITADFTLSNLSASEDFFLNYEVADAAVKQVIVNGGAKSALFDNPVLFTSDTLLHTQTKGGSPNLFKVSQTTFCFTLDFGTVSGVKYHDHDQNGEFGGTDPEDAVEAGIQGWSISAFASDGSPAGGTTTAADGSYTLALPVGSFTICEAADVPTSIGDLGWRESAPTAGADCSGFAGQAPVGYAVTVVKGVDNGNNDFGNFVTTLVGCGYTGTGEHAITLPPPGPLCTKNTVEYVLESYVRQNGEQVHDFHALEETTGIAYVTEFHTWSIGQAQGSTLYYDDGDGPFEALYCEFVPAHVPFEELADVTGLFPDGGAGEDGKHTTCIITSTEDADGNRVDTLASFIDGRRWV